MLKKRIIPTLLLRNGRMVKGVHFDSYRDTGDPVYAARVYNSQYVDELVFIDIDATEEKRATQYEIIEKVSKECFMPFTIGGGVTSSDHVRKLLQVGADKVLINTAALENPEMVKDCANRFGAQCLVIGIDVKKENGNYAIYSHSGRRKSEKKLLDHLAMMEEFGAGEFLINAIHQDGTMRGYDIELLQLVKKHTKRPIIASGGAGNDLHLVDAFKLADVDAVSMASMYHFGDNNPPRTRAYLRNNDIEIKVS